LKQYGEELIDTSSILVKDDYRTAAFTGVLDSRGDFKVGVADMKIFDEIPI
jgi:hypothetical protein